mmetsp:Transcript_6565/g.19473  ORF Transcript_6565/g.19473 Transcript_6565/m.19473 type:complete len:232 (+) Transcript_6565:187-882(+)
MGQPGRATIAAADRCGAGPCPRSLALCCPPDVGGARGPAASRRRRRTVGGADAYSFPADGCGGPSLGSPQPSARGGVRLRRHREALDGFVDVTVEDATRARGAGRQFGHASEEEFALPRPRRRGAKDALGDCRDRVERRRHRRARARALRPLPCTRLLLRRKFKIEGCQGICLREAPAPAHAARLLLRLGKVCLARSPGDDARTPLHLVADAVHVDSQLDGARGRGRGRGG